MAKRRRQRWYENEGVPKDPRLWLYGPVPTGFWHEREQRRNYVAWLGEQLGFTKLEDWYRVTGHDFHRHRGGGLLGRYNNSPSTLLKEVMPDYAWQEWLFRSAPQRFWHDRANRRRYLDWLGAQLGFQCPEDWYRLSHEALITHAGRGLLLSTRFSLLSLLKEYLPDYDWLEWRFPSVPDGFWRTRVNRHRYLDWLGRQLGFTEPEDWYQLSTPHLMQHAGNRLLQKFNSVPVVILKDYRPDYPWQEWRFAQMANGFWEKRTNRRRYVEWLESV